MLLHVGEHHGAARGAVQVALAPLGVGDNLMTAYMTAVTAYLGGLGRGGAPLAGGVRARGHEGGVGLLRPRLGRGGHEGVGAQL